MDRWHIVATLAVFSIALVVFTFSPKVSADLQGRGPILIIGDDNFTPANGVVGGSGTEDDPYIIENWVIDASKNHGIHIQNTTRYFVIRNVVVENGGSSYDGIYLENVRNGRVANVICNKNRFGIHLHDSDNNVLTNNTVENNWIGIYLSYSDNNTLESNIVENNKGPGISLHSSSHNTLSGNTARNNPVGISLFDSDNVFIENNLVENSFYCDIHIWGLTNATLRRNRMFSNRAGLDISGDSLEHFMLDIDNSNLVEAGPVLYLKGENNLVIDQDNAVGWLGLVNCDNILVRNLRLETVMFAFSTNSRVENITAENSTFGVVLMYSDNNTLSGNIVNNCLTGIFLYSSSHNILSGNTVENNGLAGIPLSSSSHNTLSGNIVKNSWDGISLYSSSYNILSGNTVENNGWGISFYSSSYNILSGNTVENNRWYGISLHSSSYNTLLDKVTGPELAERVGEFVEGAGIQLAPEELSALENSVLENVVRACLSIPENESLVKAFTREDLTVSLSRVKPGEIVELSVEGEKACVLIINLASGLLPENFRVLVDSKPAHRANSYADVLNPADEQTPEHYVLRGTGWVQVMVSIPGFSVHTITFAAPAKAPGIPWAMVLALIVIVVVAVALLVSRRKRRRALLFGEEKRRRI